jgi:cyclophilin family peptidyl-prolyl cis-trans isomerase
MANKSGLDMKWVGASAVVVALLAALAWWIYATVGGPGQGTIGLATPTPTAVQTTGGATMPVATTPYPNQTGQIAYADCSTVQFGPVLQPLNKPTGDIHTYSAPPVPQIKLDKLYLVTLHTNKGDIVLCLQPQLAPNTVNNFVGLARNNFYDGLVFHRVVAGFVIQGGDPMGTGGGGPGYKFADEPVRQQYVAGALAMANSGVGSGTNGSQFFIDSADDTSSLGPQVKNGLGYNLFGKVWTGMDVVLKIAQGDVMTTVTVQEQQ